MTTPMAPLGEDLVPTRNMEARTRSFRGKFVVAIGGQAVELDEVGALIFKRADGSSTVGDIARVIVAEYAIDYPTALTDCGEFINDLCSKGLMAV
jgi:Coenzyme PQQ synthesis protein D (PqqD)